jgi:hypothetical protein
MFRVWIARRSQRTLGAVPVVISKGFIMSAHRTLVLLFVGVALVLGFVWQFAGAQVEPAKAAVPKWEYKQVRKFSDLDALGSEGWELVSVGQPDAGLTYFYLKRPKQ